MQAYGDEQGVIVGEVEPVHARQRLDLLSGHAGDAGELHGPAHHSLRL